MAKKLYDIAVKTSEYQDAQGQTKGRYQNVGVVMEGDNGQFILLERWFNPAGLPNPDNRSNIMLSCFVPRDQQGGQSQHQQQKSNGYQPQQSGADVDCPF
jgi:hypothetical protein